jgi:steroid 5-alpha reductase family enzyme
MTLAAHARVIGHPEEGRYVQLRREWGGNLPLKFLAFFEFQALLCVVLSGPFLLAAMNPRPEWSLFERAGAGLRLIALIGEIAADSHLAAFKRNPANRGKTCQAGLWLAGLSSVTQGVALGWHRSPRWG